MNGKFFVPDSQHALSLNIISSTKFQSSSSIIDTLIFYFFIESLKLNTRKSYLIEILIKERERKGCLSQNYIALLSSSSSSQSLTIFVCFSQMNKYGKRKQKKRVFFAHSIMKIQIFDQTFIQNSYLKIYFFSISILFAIIFYRYILTTTTFVKHLSLNNQFKYFVVFCIHISFKRIFLLFFTEKSSVIHLNEYS